MSMQAFFAIITLGCFTFAGAQTSSIVTFREGGGDTVARGINNLGQITGYFTPSNGVFTRGFIRAADGTVQTVLAPGANDTRLHAINLQGETVGTKDNNTSAFFRTAAGVFTNITVTDAVAATANGINNNGYVVGGFQRMNTSRRAYLRNLVGGIVPLADFFPGDVEAVAVSNSGDRVVLMQNTSIGSVIHISTPQGNFASLTPNLGFFGYAARGLNASNTLVGEVNNQGFLVRTPGDGVVFSIPNSTATMPYGINDQNQIVGAVRDNENRLSGFVMNPCSPVLTATSRSHGSGAEAGVIEIQTEGLCVWIAEADVPWITLTRSIGSGPTGIRYALGNNTSGARQGRIRIGTREFAITQAGNECQYTVTPPILTAPVAPGGGSVNFNVATGASCPWTAFSVDPWVRFSPASGTGTSTVTAQVDPIVPTATAARTSTANLAGRAVPITQAAMSCNAQVNRSVISVPADGALENVRVTMRAECGWFIQGPEWITLLTPSGFQGTATVTLRIARNPGIAPRSATVTIFASGAPALPLASFSVNQQAGTSCSYSLGFFDSATAPAEGNSGSFNVTGGPNCPLTVTSDVPWIELLPTPPVVSSSSTFVAYRVLRNPSRLPRRGLIRISGGVVFTIDQLGDTRLGISFVPINACRVMDTRAGQGFTSDQGPPALVANQTRTLNIVGRCGVPPNARAFALNVTAFPTTTLTFLTVWPAFQPRPLASALNSFNGRVVSNMAIIPGPAPAWFYASETTNLAVDVIGYFTDPSPESLVLYPVAPCRVLDTRTANTPLAAGPSRDVPVAGRCGIPANAAAFSLNATAVPRGRLDSVTLWQAGAPRPTASTLNAPGGQVTANAALVASGTGGAVSVSASHETDFVLDANGYFGLPSDTGLYFNVVNPCRIADTRVSQGGPILVAGVSRTIVPSSMPCGIPSDARAHLVNATVVPPGPLAFLSLFRAPDWTGNSTLNAFDGQVTANLAIVPDDGQGIGAFASHFSHLVLDISGYFATLPVEQRRPTVIPSQ